MSKVVHIVALTQDNIDLIYGSLMTIQELCMATLVLAQQSEDAQAISNAQESIEAIQEVVQKIEPKINAQGKEVFDREMEKMKGSLNDFYNPRRES